VVHLFIPVFSLLGDCYSFSLFILDLLRSFKLGINFDRSYMCRNLCNSKILNSVGRNFPNIFLWISVVSVLISLFSLLILFVFSFSFY
jgi:hypothetical protein